MLRDISIALGAGTPEWPGDTPYARAWTWCIAQGASVNVSAITTSPHVGTHADAPLHVRDGWPGAHDLPLDAFIGLALVVDVSAWSGPIAYDELPPEARGAPRLLLRTGRTIADGGFPEDWPVLAEDCVRALLSEGLRLVGVDAPSVDARASTELPVHHLLFAGNAYILENLDLRDVAPGAYELVAPPLKAAGLDAAPVRAILRDLPQ